jgi:hypothetical protein
MAVRLHGTRRLSGCTCAIRWRWRSPRATVCLVPQLFTALCALPSALCFVLVLLLVDESPRFLLVRGRGAEALSILNDACRAHGRPRLTVRRRRGVSSRPCSVRLAAGRTPATYTRVAR